MKKLNSLAIGITLALYSTAGQGATFQATALEGNCPNGTGNQTVQYTIDDTAFPAGTVNPPLAFVSPIQASSGNANCVASSNAYAGPGALGVRADATAIGHPLAAASASAILQASDIAVIPLVNRSQAELTALYGTDIKVRPNIVFSGEVGVDSDVNLAAIQANVNLSGRSSTGLQGDQDTIRPTTRASGNFGIGGFERIVSGAFSYNFADEIEITIDPQNTMFLNMRILGLAQARSGGNIPISSAAARSYNSLSFATDGPAFFVPDGYTVFAPSLNIFDNQWVDTRTFLVPVTSQPSAVPLPASSLLLLAGLGGLAALRKRTSKA